MMENIKDSKSRRLAIQKRRKKQKSLSSRSENIRMNGLLKARLRSLAYPIDVLFSRVNVRNLIAE